MEVRQRPNDRVARINRKMFADRAHVVDKIFVAQRHGLGQTGRSRSREEHGPVGGRRFALHAAEFVKRSGRRFDLHDGVAQHARRGLGVAAGDHDREGLNEVDGGQQIVGAGAHVQRDQRAFQTPDGKSQRQQRRAVGQQRHQPLPLFETGYYQRFAFRGDGGQQRLPLQPIPVPPKYVRGGAFSQTLPQEIFKTFHLFPPR